MTEAALVTGGGTGLGLATALALAADGRPVAIFSRSPEHVESAAGRIRSAGGRALGVAGDVRDPAAVEDAVARIERDLAPVGVLINNAAGNFLVAAEELSPNG
ncbi:MAG TPA: SDR family NAD(P)-dependent oxidoreductase, partial [Thermoanaerobaculia bacterium]|nr:SDR family NAD(P)-dependent oxidoreductase [Thermoanaerobaculia bacterium]